MYLEQAIICRIKQLCKQNKITIEQLLKQSKLAKSTINTIKKNGNIKIYTIFYICNALNMKINDFFCAEIFDDNLQ